MKNEFITFGLDCISENKFNKVSNEIKYNKPRGGLWTCPYVKNMRFSSEWEMLVVEKRLTAYTDISKAVSFSFNDNSNIYTINTQADLVWLLEKYNISKSKEKILDFESIATKYDALHLTKNGLLETDNDNEANLIGWDVESLLIFNIECIDKESIKNIYFFKK